MNLEEGQTLRLEIEMILILVAALPSKPTTQTVRTVPVDSQSMKGPCSGQTSAPTPILSWLIDPTINPYNTRYNTSYYNN